MASSPWERLGQAANFMQLTGVDALGLVSMIVQASKIARGNKDLCEQLAQHVEIVGGLLKELKIPELRRRPGTRRTLDQLNDVLFRALKLVKFCSDQQQTTSLVRQMFTGHDVAAKLRQAQEEIDRYITLVSLIVSTDHSGGQEEAEDEATNDPTPAEKRRQRGDLSSFNDSVKEFTLNQLSISTKGFSLEFRLSYNQNSTWYWGKLGDGREVAVKRFLFGSGGRRFNSRRNISRGWPSSPAWSTGTSPALSATAWLRRTKSACWCTTT
ncbi:hypothetical protein ACP70R_040883 [Stipagrostis hirtigluma subsp. patula]